VTGAGPELRILVAGDSAAAGVGAPTQEEALTGRLVQRLAPRYTVRWRLEARTGATTAETIRRLQGLTGEVFDVLVTSLGVNDVTRRVGRAEWLDQQRALRDLARRSLGVRYMVISGLPPVHAFPALPQPLRWYLGSEATRFTRTLEADVAPEPAADYLDLRFATDPALMASDRFHPGPDIYAEWAARAAALIESGSAHWRPPRAG
jgi:lysophospholipase L1-like esterase